MTWQYIAGFFDGEGNVNTSSSHGRSWTVRIVQSETEVLNRIAEFLKNNNIESHLYHSYKASQYKKAKKDLWCLQLSGESNVKDFLIGVLPFLIVKEPVAQDIIRFLKIYPTRNANARGFVSRRLNDIKQIPSKDRMVTRNAA